jgi:hypothetical protein
MVVDGLLFRLSQKTDLGKTQKDLKAYQAMPVKGLGAAVGRPFLKWRDRRKEDCGSGCWTDRFAQIVIVRAVTVVEEV